MNNKEEVYIDDTPMDLSDTESLSDEEYKRYWENRKKEIQKQSKN